MTPIALTIAGSDSSGGAGIEADLKTFSALGVYGATVITALTAQNTKEVRAIHAVPAEFVAAQIDAVFSDLRVNAVKIGMLWQAEVIKTVAAALGRWDPGNVVLDPVLVATSGARLLAPSALELLKRTLFPCARLLTPNLLEAAALLDASVAQSEEDMREQGERLLAFGPRAVLMKGGHGAGAQSLDLLIEPQDCMRLVADLSAAIAAGLAKCLDLAEAVRRAKEFVTAALAAADALEVGSGRGPVHQFHGIWPKQHAY
jgi:hydroxymethylpyrimidine/phosphomethylpyrimidine kinase